MCVCCQVPDIATRLLGCPKCSVPSWPRQGSRRCRLDEVGCDGCHCGPRFCSAACVSAVSCSAGGGTSSGFARSHFLATLTMYVRALDHSVQLPGAGGMLWHLEEEALQPGGLITALSAGSSAGARRKTNGLVFAKQNPIKFPPMPGDLELSRKPKRWL